MSEITYSEAQDLFGKNYFGLKELEPMFKAMGEKLPQSINIPLIPYSKEDLEQYAANGYILILGANELGEEPLTIRKFRKCFGINHEMYEPCLYNQDWYMAENFIDKPLATGWYLIKKDVIEESRAKQPTDILKGNIHFPSAILCTYTFFAYYFQNKEYLWWHDFIWCDDVDHNGDRIYVGKYHDIDGVNKNGFSIHRHLALRPCYASVDAR